MEVEASGLHLVPDTCSTGASSDGKVLYRNVDTCSLECSEIKCPYSINEQVTVSINSYRNSWWTSNFLWKGVIMFCYMFLLIMHIIHRFRWDSCVRQEWCIFVVFSNDTVVVDWIVVDYDYWINLLEKLEQFYLRHVKPELLPGEIF